MADTQTNPIEPVPQALSHLIALNVEYKVLICIGNGCRHALKPTAIPRHLVDKHNTPIVLQRQVDQYIKAFLFDYDYTSVQLPGDGSVPQPIILVVDGFACRDCQFKSQSRVAIRQHINKTYNKKRVADEEIFKAVRL
jgi:hypothetical protein